MSSTLSSGWYTCPGCFRSFRWDNAKVDAHTASCPDYKIEMKYRAELQKKAIKIPLGNKDNDKSKT